MSEMGCRTCDLTFHWNTFQNLEICDSSAADSQTRCRLLEKTHTFREECHHLFLYACLEVCRIVLEIPLFVFYMPCE